MASSTSTLALIKGVHHVSFTVSEMERSVRFYRDGLGFELRSDREADPALAEKVSGMAGARLRIVHLFGHGQGLELIEYRSPPGACSAPRTCDVGSAHLCYVVRDIDRVIEHLKEHGARFLSEPVTVDGGPNAGNRCVYFLDPDGIPMELTEPAR